MFVMLWVLFGAVLVVYVLPQFIKVRVKPKTVEPKPITQSIIHLFDGPHDGTVQKIPMEADKLPHYFVTPYVPLDEDGNPVPDESHIVHQGNGMVYVRPNLAYYQQVTEEDYFYVRDINEQELKKIQITGELPQFKVDDDN